MQSNASSIEEAASIPVVALNENFIIIRNFHLDRWSFVYHKSAQRAHAGVFSTKAQSSRQQSVPPLEQRLAEGIQFLKFRAGDCCETTGGFFRASFG